MRIFLSYASDDRSIAEEIAVRLELENHHVFFDRDDLPSGHGYDQIIRQEIKSCDLFIFLISPDSVTRKRYTLTEVKFARKKWRNLNGRLLPVMARPTDFSSIPAALAALDVLEPDGNLAAEVVAQVASMAESTEETAPTPHYKRWGLAAAVIVALIVGLQIGAPWKDPQPVEIVEDPPIAVTAVEECEQQTELASCGLDLALKICSEQRTTAALLDAGDTLPESPDNGGRRYVRLFGVVHSQDAADATQLNTFLSNLRHSIVSTNLEPVPSAGSERAFLDGPVALENDYQSSGAAMVVSAQLNPPYLQDGVQIRGGDSEIYFGSGSPISVSFQLPENRFSRPLDLHKAAIAYSRARLAPDAEQKLALLNVAREAVNRACKGS